MDEPRNGYRIAMIDVGKLVPKALEKKAAINKYGNALSVHLFAQI